MTSERSPIPEPIPPYNPRYRLVEMGEIHTLFPPVDNCRDETTALPTERFALLGAPAIHIVAFTESHIVPHVHGDATNKRRQTGERMKRQHLGILSVDVRCLQTDANEGYEYTCASPLLIKNEHGVYATHFSSTPFINRSHNPNASLLIWRCSMFRPLDVQSVSSNDGLRLALEECALTVPFVQEQRSKWTISFGTK